MINIQRICFGLLIVEKSESLSKTYYVKCYRYRLCSKTLIEKYHASNYQVTISLIRSSSVLITAWKESITPPNVKRWKTITTIWNYKAKRLWNRICGTTSICQAVCRLFPTAGRSWALGEITQNVFLKRVSQAGEWGHHGENATPAFSAAPWESSDQKTAII